MSRSKTRSLSYGTGCYTFRTVTNESITTLQNVKLLNTSYVNTSSVGYFYSLEGLRLSLRDKFYIITFNL